MLERLKEICKELLNQGIWPPYTIVVKDARGTEAHLNVTLESLRPAGVVPHNEGEPIDMTIEVQ